MMILVAAVLLAATSLIQSYYARRGLLMEAEQRAQREMLVSRLRIENITGPIEGAARNTSWMVQMNLAYPDTLFSLLRNVVEANPLIADVAVAFVPNYYKAKGYWFEPLVARREGNVLEEMVLGSPSHDYLSSEWFTTTVRSGQPVWSEPYYDESGGRTMVVTYTYPVKDKNGDIVAVVGADLTLEWLGELLHDIQLYPNTYSFLVSREGQMLVAPTTEKPQKGTVQFSMPIESTGWNMTVIIPRNEIFRTVNRLSGMLALLQVLGLLLLGAIAFKSVRDQNKLDKVRQKKDKLDNELRISREIQMAMVPKTFPPFPERKDIDLAAAIVPAREVGGDLYDYYIRDDKLFFCIGDVSGKGVPAALVMAVTRSLFRTVSAHEKRPVHIVSSMNESMYEMNDSNMFVTLFCGVLNLNTGHLHYCNAGHNPPVVLADAVDTIPVTPNLPLGVMPDFAFQGQDCYIKEGTSLVLYTDGITEAENAGREQFGMHRLTEALKPESSVEENKKRVLDSVEDFVGEAERSDDITLLIFRYLGADESAVRKRRLTLSNDIRQIPQLAEFILAIADEKHLPSSLATNLNLALEEAVTNVMLYAYPKDTEGLIEIEALLKEDSLEFALIDSGEAFDPTAVPEVDINMELKDRKIGGLGIHLVRKIMDEVRYRREDGRNVLTMIKNI